jgi:hypothetical protein
MIYDINGSIANRYDTCYKCAQLIQSRYSISEKYSWYAKYVLNVVSTHMI